MDAFAVFHIRAWLDAKDASRLHVTNHTAAPSTWVSKRAWHRELMASEREKAGIALGEEEQGQSTSQAEQVIGQGDGGGGGYRRSCWDSPFTISEAEERPTHLEYPRRHRREGLQ